MGSSYLDGNELRTRALNWSDSLATRTREAVRIGTLHEQQVLIVHHVFRPDDSLQTLEVGTLLPAHATALGKVLLAAPPVRRGGARGDGLTPTRTPRSPIRDRLERELDRVRAQGWAADIGELVPGQVSYAAPIVDRRGHDRGRDGHLRSARAAARRAAAAADLLAYVREGARAVSRELGAIPW